MGLPAVATDIKGNREAIVPGETGLLIPPKDPVAAADALAQILTSPEVALEMGKRAAERGRKLYDTRDMARQVEEIYAKILRSKSRRSRA
jgi:glycosyltransferase involved in cell wall biosynthesis